MVWNSCWGFFVIGQSLGSPHLGQRLRLVKGPVNARQLFLHIGWTTESTPVISLMRCFIWAYEGTLSSRCHRRIAFWLALKESMEEFIFARKRSMPRRRSGSEVMSKGVVGGFLSRWIMFFSILHWMSSWDADWSAQMNSMELSKSLRQVFSKILSTFSHVEESSGWAVPALLSWSLGSESRHPGSGSELMLFSESSRALSEGNGWRSVAGSETSRAEKLLELGGKGWLGVVFEG
jgi:hypothetical protein